MQEIIKVRQIAGEASRRWFTSGDFDLIVWLAEDGRPTGFELCYDKRRHERSIVWQAAGGFRHMAVDDGEQRPGKYKSTPLLVADGVFEARRVRQQLAAVAGELPAEIACFVLQVLAQHPDFAGEAAG